MRFSKARHFIQLNELFDNPLPWRWVSGKNGPRNYEAEWRKGSERYSLIGSVGMKSHRGYWANNLYVEFSEAMEGYKASGKLGMSGNKVFSTVFAILEEILRLSAKKYDNPIQSMTFSASLESGQRPERRQKLYVTMARIIGKKFGFEIKTSVGGRFILVNTGKFPEFGEAPRGYRSGYGGDDEDEEYGAPSRWVEHQLSQYDIDVELADLMADEFGLESTSEIINYYNAHYIGYYPYFEDFAREQLGCNGVPREAIEHVDFDEMMDDGFFNVTIVDNHYFADY